jgi:hypothetical protein
MDFLTRIPIISLVLPGHSRCNRWPLFHSQTRNGKPSGSMKAWQRGQRPGFFHASTKCFAFTGHSNFIFCHSNRRGTAGFGTNRLSRKITGGISGRTNAENFRPNSLRPTTRRTRVKTSNSSRQSRQWMVCTSQFTPLSAPPEMSA